MRKLGIVVEVKPEYAVVEVSRKSACESCQAACSCGGCVSLGNDRETRARAENTIGAHVGDRVVVETSSGTIIMYAAAVFLLPLVAGIVGFFLGGFIAEGTAQYVCSLIGFAGAFAFLYFVLNKQAEKRRDVKIVGIVGDNDV